MAVRDLGLVWDCVQWHFICNLKDQSIYFDTDITTIHRDSSFFFLKKVPSPHMKISFWFLNENGLSFHLKILDSFSYEGENGGNKESDRDGLWNSKLPFPPGTWTKGGALASPLKFLLLHLNYWYRNGWERNSFAISYSPTGLNTSS